MSCRSMPTTLPETLSSSSLPSTTKFAGADVAVDGVAVVFPHDDFLVGRGHSAQPFSIS